MPSNNCPTLVRYLRAFYCSMLLCWVTVIGCSTSGPEIASVEGTVTLDSKPLSTASVVFIPPGGRPAGATTNQDGFYVLNFTKGRQGSMPGKNRIRISTLRDPGVDADGNPVPAQKEIIPMEYN